jgi:hypothetical protein
VDVDGHAEQFLCAGDVCDVGATALASGALAGDYARAVYYTLLMYGYAPGDARPLRHFKGDFFAIFAFACSGFSRRFASG